MLLNSSSPINLVWSAKYREWIRCYMSLSTYVGSFIVGPNSSIALGFERPQMFAMCYVFFSVKGSLPTQFKVRNSSFRVKDKESCPCPHPDGIQGGHSSFNFWFLYGRFFLAILETWWLGAETTRCTAAVRLSARTPFCLNHPNVLLVKIWDPASLLSKVNHGLLPEISHLVCEAGRTQPSWAGFYRHVHGTRWSDFAAVLCTTIVQKK